MGLRCWSCKRLMRPGAGGIYYCDDCMIITGGWK